MIVYVYRNLHKNCFSVMYKGKVIDHVNQIKLVNVTFVVRKGGYQKFLETKNKNVHAFVKGTIKDFKKSCNEEVIYNPKIANYFFVKSNKNSILESKFVNLINNKIFIP